MLLHLIQSSDMMVVLGVKPLMGLGHDFSSPLTAILQDLVLWCFVEVVADLW